MSNNKEFMIRITAYGNRPDIDKDIDASHYDINPVSTYFKYTINKDQNSILEFVKMQKITYPCIKHAILELVSDLADVVEEVIVIVEIKVPDDAKSTSNEEWWIEVCKYLARISPKIVRLDDGSIDYNNSKLSKYHTI